MSIAKTSGNFLDSEIMRSLEKVAIKRGLVDPASMKKTASAPKQLKSTGDIYSDLISLVASLRDRGYEKEANDLEDKIHVYKIAKDNYKKLCDEELVDSAHPEGDAEVAPSKEDYGKVETITSTQKKILDKIRKMPTGKLAKAAAEMNELLKIAVPEKTEQEALRWITANVVSKSRALAVKLEQMADDLFWWEDATWGLSEDEITVKLSKAIAGYLRTWAKHGLDPESLMESISRQMIANAPLHWDDEKDLWVGKLFSAGTAGNGFDFIAGQNIQRTKEGREREEAKKQKEESAGSGKPAKEYGLGGVVASFNSLVASLRSIRGSSETHPDNRARAKELENHCVAILRAIKSSRTLVKLRALLAKIMPNIDWTNADEIDTKRILEKEVKVIGQWVNVLESDKSYKEASRSDKLQKLAQTPPPGSQKEEKAKPNQQQQITWLLSKTQDELKNLADVIESRKRKGWEQIIATLRNSGPRGSWSDALSKALEAAEAVRSKHTPRVPTISTRPSAATPKNLQQMIESIKKIPVVESFGEYEDVKIAKKDVLTPYHLYLWAVENSKLPFNQDAQGNEVIKLQEFTQLINSMMSDAKSQVASAEGRDQKKSKIAYLRALSKVAKDYTQAAIASGAAKQGSSGTMHVKDLSSTPTPGTAGQGSGKPAEGSPFGQMLQVGESGRLAAPVQIEFITGGRGSIGAGFPANAYPPITNVLDLSSRWWNMPENHILEYGDWSTADADSLASLYFGDARRWPQHVQQAVQDAFQGAVTRGTQQGQDPQEISRQLMAHGAKYAFRDFLNRLGADISRVYSSYNNSIKNPNIRRKLVVRSGKDAQEWLRLIRQMASELSRR